MIPSMDGINPDKQHIPEIKNKNIQSAGELSFDSELSSLLKNKNTGETTKQEEISDIDLSGQLKGLNKSNLSALNFSGQKMKVSAETLQIPGEKIYGILNNLREELMGSIKKSVLNLENIIKDENLKIPPDLKEKFLAATSSIKNDFTKGFGTDFDTYGFKDINYDDDLISKLINSKDFIPENFAKKMDLLYPFDS